MSLVDIVRDAGIIGCGGAGFPTHVKIDATVDLVLANGAECEPLLASDQRVMEYYADEILEGLLLIMSHTGATKGMIGTKKHYHGAVDALNAAIDGRGNVELGLMGNYYPAGDEHILLADLTGRIVPEGGIPLQVGAVVSNVLTMVQIARAARGQVVTDRVVTLVGEVEQPQVVIAPIGTPVMDLLLMCQPRLPLEDIVIIDGGPMMGRVVTKDASVNKTTSGYLFLPKDHPVIQYKQIPLEAMIRRSVAACCQCRLCTDACSRYMQGHAIEPHRVMRTLAYQLEAPTSALTAAFLCSQCGLCEFACPMYLSPKRAYAEVLQKLRAAGVKNPHHRAPEKLHEFNQYRKIGKDRITRRYQLKQYEDHDLPLTRIPEPPRVAISLTQQTGAPSEPVVRKGERVSKGQLIARIPSGKLGANHHASISGQVLDVTGDRIVIMGG